VTTVRDEFGLALSSRNTRLTAEHLGQAPQIYILLSEIAEKCRTHETFSAAVKDRFTTELPAVTAATVEYVEVVHSNTLQPAQIATNGTTICVAVWFGDVRLIDNVSIGPALA
jgi:pantoate--beta-alanine ligase